MWGTITMGLNSSNSKYKLRITLGSILLFQILMAGSIHAEDSHATPIQEYSVNEASANDTQENLIIAVNDTTKFVIPGGVPESVDELGYASLDTTSKAHFHKNRIEVLRLAATLLNSAHLTFGFGSLSANKLNIMSHSIGKPTPRINPIDAYAAGTMGLTDDWILERDAWRAEKDRLTEKRSIRERSYKIIEKILLSINKTMWSQAPLAARSQEFGMIFTINAASAIGFGHQALGGSVGLGVSLGYNKNTRSLVFEIVQDAERVQHALPTVGVIGFIAKLGFYMSAADHRLAPGIALPATSFYPPVAPAFTTTGPEKFIAGVNGSLTLPPSPIADVFSWTSSSKTTTLVRIAVSPMFKGFVKFQVNREGGPIGAIIKTVEAAHDWITTRIAKHRGLCRSVYR